MLAKPDQTPTFNLKAVIRETGLKPDTLRAWERRYGLPRPQRTAGGHRLYSQQDIDTLKWLVARQQEGLSISRAVGLWHKLKADGKDPFRTSPSGPAHPSEATALPVEGDVSEGLRQAWLTACLAFDELRAEQVLSQAFALYPVETVCFDLLLAAMAEVGHGWYAGAISEQQEHYTSALAIRRLEALLAATPRPTRPGRILIGCPAGEEHAFSALMLALLLRRRGWDVLYLGPNVPRTRLETTVKRVSLSLVTMAAHQLATAATLLEIGRELQRAQVPLAFGGLIFNRIPELRSRIPGHFLGERLVEAPERVETLLTSPGAYRPGRTALALPEAFQETLRHFQAQQGLIEAEVWDGLRGIKLPQAYFATANNYMARNIVAALALGDLEFLRPDIVWVEGLLANDQTSSRALAPYLEVYAKAVRKCLGEWGESIETVLSSIVRT